MSDHDKPIFIDGIGSIVFMAGVIRADLGCYSITSKDEKGNPAFEVKGQLIISPQGFLQVTNAFNSLVQRLKDSGVLQAREEGAVSKESREKETDKRKK